MSCGWHSAPVARTRNDSSVDAQNQIREALLSPDGVKATSKLRARFAGGKELMATDRNEYQGFGYLLQEIWGFQL